MRNRSDKPDPIGAQVRQLAQDLVAQIPGQDENIIWAVVIERFNRAHRNMAARQERVLFGRIAIHSIGDQVAANAAIIEQRIAFRSRAIGRNGSALGFGLVEIRGLPDLTGPTVMLGSTVGL